MKTIYIWGCMIFSIDRYLHQSYTYDDGAEGRLLIECVIDGKRLSADISLTAPFCYLSALWQIAQQATAGRYRQR